MSRKTEHTAPQDLERDLEDEGVPDLEGPLDEKAMTGDAQEGVAPPRERPGAVRDYGVTAAEQRTDEPLRRRLLREQPDVGDAGAEETPEPVGRLVEPESGVDEQDETAEAIASDVGDDNRGFTAEEAAMHPTDL
jgi:uncharacterized protein DUF5709